MAGSAVLPERSYGPGITDLPPRSIAGALTSVGFEYDITQHTNPAIVVQVLLELSPDGGTVWGTIGSFQRTGGPAGSGPQGPATLAGATFGFPSGTNRMIRGSLVITGGSFITSGTLRWA
jgi:hypothetical protein